MRLSVKLLLSVAAVIGLVVGASVVAAVRLQRSAGLQQTELAAQTLASAIYHGLEVSMIRNNPDEMREIIQSLQSEPMVRRVEIFAADGRLWTSSDGSGPRVALDPADLERAVREGRPLVREHPHTGELLALQPIVNRPACQGCHAADIPTLGVVSVALDTTRLNRQVASSTRLLEGLLALTALAAMLVLSLPLSRFVLRPVRALASGVTRLARGDYSTRVEWHGNDEMGLLARAFNDMAERIQRYTAGLNREIACLTGRLTGLSLLGRTLTEVSAAQRALDEVVEEAARLVAADGCALFLEDGTARSWGSAELVERFLQPGAGEGPPFGLAVPMAIQERRLGRLVVVRRQGPAFGQDDRAVLEAVGHLVAIALENARLFGQLREKEMVRGQLLARAMAAQEEERRRIARELHDEVGQSLTALMLRIDLALQGLPPDGAALREALEGLRSLTENTLGEVRRMIYDLRPSALDDLDLASAVEWFARTHLEPAGISVELEVSGLDGERLAPALETAVFRVAQEAVTNVIRHARARRVRIRLARVPADGPGAGEELELVVQDDGQGFDPAAVMQRRDAPPLGLVGMRERVELAGGRLAIEAAPGRGTRLQARIPLGG